MRPASETCPPACALSSTLPHSRIRHLVALACGGLQLALGQPSAGVFRTPTPSLHRQFANFCAGGPSAAGHGRATRAGTRHGGSQGMTHTLHCISESSVRSCSRMRRRGLLRLLFRRRCDLVADPGICLWTKHEGAGDGEICFARGAFSSLQLHPASSSSTFRNKVQRTGKTVLATRREPYSASAAECALDSSASLPSLSPLVGCRALHSFVWRGSLLKTWDPYVAVTPLLCCDSHVNKAKIENEKTELPAPGREQSWPLA